MKTRVIILSAAISALLISCKTDRSQDEEIQSSPVSKVELKKLKIENNGEEANRPGDSIIVVPPKTQSSDPENLDQNEIVPPGGVIPPKP